MKTFLLSETARHKRTNKEVSRIVVFLKTENRMVVIGGGGMKRNGGYRF